MLCRSRVDIYPSVPRPSTDDMRSRVDIYPSVPSPFTVDMRSRVDIYPSVPRPSTVLRITSVPPCAKAGENTVESDESAACKVAVEI